MSHGKILQAAGIVGMLLVVQMPAAVAVQSCATPGSLTAGVGRGLVQQGETQWWRSNTPAVQIVVVASLPVRVSVVASCALLAETCILTNVSFVWFCNFTGNPASHIISVTDDGNILPVDYLVTERLLL